MQQNVKICSFLFIHSSMDTYLGCFYFSVIMNDITINLHVQGFVWIRLVFMPIIPATWEAEEGGPQVPGRPEQYSKTLSQNQHC
jgi:hypothetical protein